MISHLLSTIYEKCSGNQGQIMFTYSVLGTVSQSLEGKHKIQPRLSE